GGVVSHFDYDTRLAEMKAIARLPSQGTLGLIGAHVITPGDPFSSTLYYRIMTTGQGRMPHIGSRLLDLAGASLIREWIAQLPKQLAEDKADNAAAEKLRTEIAELLQLVGSASVQSGQILDRLLASVNGALALSGKIQPHAQPFGDLLVEKTIA